MFSYLVEEVSEFMRVLGQWVEGAVPAGVVNYTLGNYSASGPFKS